MAVAEINGARIAYADIGEGLPLLCLHGGMGLDARTLHVPGVLDLARRGVRLVIPDQRGHGSSSRAPRADYTHEIWANDARALAGHLRLDRLALLGHSYGGFIALEYAVRWPDSLSHLVLVATSAGPVRPGMPEAADDDQLRESFRRIWPGLFPGANKHWPLFESIGFSAEPYIAAFTRELPAYDLRERVRDLRVPTLLVVGEHDGYRGPMAWIHQNARNVRLVTIAGAGHLPFVDAPQEFAAAVESFLTARGQGIYRSYP